MFTMESFMLRINGLGMRSIVGSTVSVRGKDVRIVSLSLVLDNALVINGLTLEMNGVNPGEERRSISNNDTRSDVRLCDFPSKHSEQERFLIDYLEDKILIGMNEVVNGTHYDEIASILSGRRDTLEDIGSFLPKSWPGPIEVPVQFITISRIIKHYGVTQGDIYIGHHIKMLGVRIYPELRYEERIIDKRIIDEINGILSMKGAKENIENHAPNNHEYSLSVVSQDCNWREIPPIRFCQ